MFGWDDKLKHNATGLTHKLVSVQVDHSTSKSPLEPNCLQVTEQYVTLLSSRYERKDCPAVYSGSVEERPFTDFVS